MAFDYYNTKRRQRVSLKEMLCVQGFKVQGELNLKGLTARQIAGMVQLQA